MANTTKKTTAKKRATTTAKMSGASMSARNSGTRSTARRNNNTTNRKKTNESEKPGFTIIEVVLVLAIAGLIFLMVFIALPQLQRAQRDTQRRNDLARVTEAITSFQTNNNGRIPAASGDKVDSKDTGDDGTAPLDKCTNNATTPAKCLVANYLNSAEDAQAGKNRFIGPDGRAYGLQVKNFSEYSLPTYDNIIYVYPKAKCDGENVVSGGVREYAVTYRLEGNGVYCQGNGSA